jgi:hypothetical protein
MKTRWKILTGVVVAAVVLAVLYGLLIALIRIGMSS